MSDQVDGSRIRKLAKAEVDRFIEVTQSVDLDAMETKTNFITVTQAVNLDTIETNSNASKVKTDFITVTQAVDLDAIETAVAGLGVASNVEFAQVTGAFISDVAANAIVTNATLTSANAAATPTMGTNSPIAGAPTKWIAIDDNGTTRYIPTWSV